MTLTLTLTLTLTQVHRGGPAAVPHHDPLRHGVRRPLQVLQAPRHGLPAPLRVDARCLPAALALAHTAAGERLVRARKEKGVSDISRG